MRLRPPRPLSLVALVTLTFLLLPTAPARADGEWPFGKSRGATFARGRDLYNLGVLGAKARGADDPGPARSVDMGGGRRRFEGGGKRANDDGPTAFVIEFLYPGGPAETAGLVVGDVIVGIGRTAFKEPALAPLAEALTKAEAGKKKGVVTLLVRSEEDEKARKVPVRIDVYSPAAAKPTQGEGRTWIVDTALAWLEERQVGGGGFPQTLSGSNGAVVLTSLAGLAWLAGGSDLDEGPYAANVEMAANFVGENAGRTMRRPRGTGHAADRLSQMQGMDQTNWGHAHAAIFLGELHARSPRPNVRVALERSAAALVQTQEPSGGWAHGPGGPNPLGYTELNIVTGLALAGIGLAARAGWEVPEGVVEKAEAYLKASSGGDGGIGYSDQPGQRGQGNLGRTAGCWLAYRTLDRAGTGWGKKMEKWLGRNAGQVFGGHASLMQHVLLGGVVAHAIGGKAKRAYWDVAERDLVLARAPDGSLQPRPWHESLSMSSNSDVTFGEVWTTAAWAIVLACEPEKGVRPGLPAWMGLD